MRSRVMCYATSANQNVESSLSLLFVKRVDTVEFAKYRKYLNNILQRKWRTVRLISEQLLEDLTILFSREQ